MYPITMIPMNWGDIVWGVEGEVVEVGILEVKFELSGIIDETKTDVPIKAPPTINKTVKTLDLMLKPIPYDKKKNIIETPPNIIPLSFAESGINP